MIRAKYVTVQGDRLYAVYDIGVRPAELEGVVPRLRALPGVEARTAHASLGEPTAQKRTVLWMQVLPVFSADRAQKLFRQLTEPELAIAIAHLEIRFGLCRCGETSITVSEPVFLPEFAPKDIESFDLRLYAALQQLDAWSLIEKQSRPPFKPLGDALERLLAKLGAYASSLYIEPHCSPNLPCIHK